MGVADMNVISLGWGIQSFTLAAMVALGELPPVDAAIHADTTHERSQTYDFAKRWTPWLEEHGVRVVTVQNNDTKPIDRFGGMMLPAYMWKDNKPAKFDRQCTDNWKRAPMRRWLQANRNGEIVHMYLGISLDEYQRMKDSDVKYIIHHWPLVEQHITRRGCVEWLKNHHLEVPVKSSCVF
jgi:3'-phosphoadenosine 5'-phosphosulfate sulfotransferase (PAPS reductase)/FAD synthetase